MTNILAICQAKIPSALIGVINPMSALSLTDENVNFDFKTSVEITVKDFLWADVLICIRGTEPLEKQIVAEFKRLGKYIIYYLDDDLLNVPQESVSSAYFSTNTVKDNINDIISLADCFWTNNINIAEKYSGKTEKTVITKLFYDIKQSSKDAICIQTIQDNENIQNIESSKNIQDIDNTKNVSDTQNILSVENILDTEKISITQKNVTLENTAKVTIGFAGSIDHTKYIDMLISEAIKEIKQEYSERVDFIFFGSKPDIVESLKLRYIPYESDYASYIEKLKEQRLDIALAPLIDSPFHKCKFYNKYLEYSSLCIPAVYSKVEPYTFVVEDNLNGILSENTKESWKENIIKLIEDEQLRKRIAQNAQHHVRENFSKENVILDIKEQLSEALSYKSKEIKFYHVEGFPISQRLVLPYKISRIIHVHGINAPIYIIKKIILKIKFKM